MSVFVSARGKCFGGQKESTGGEGEEVYPHCSGDQLGGRQSVGVGIRYKVSLGATEVQVLGVTHITRTIYC